MYSGARNEASFFDDARRAAQPFRASLSAPAPIPVAPSVRQLTGWLTRHPDTLNEDERLELKTILDRSPILTTTALQVRGFAEMLTERHRDRLPGWMNDVQDNGAPALRSFANGARGAATRAGDFQDRDHLHTPRRWAERDLWA